MSAKTYDRQSGKLIARIAENLPEMSGDIMQGWIDNPKALQGFLAGLCPPTTTLIIPDKFREMIAAGTMIVHRGVKVNRGRTPKEAIAATGRKQYVNETVVATMPRGIGEIVDLYYVKRDCFTNDDAWGKYLKTLGLEPDPYAQAADNEANQSFADDHPNSTHWKNSKGEWCFSAFGLWYEERNMGVDRCGDGWSSRWWFGGRELVL
jgi:hypothetical protein